MTFESDESSIVDELARIITVSETTLFANANVIETDAGIAIFLPDRHKVETIFSDWAEGLVEDWFGRADFKLDPAKLIKRETGERATAEEAATVIESVENTLKREHSGKVFKHSLRLWDEHLPHAIDDAVLDLLHLVHLRAHLDWIDDEIGGSNSEAHYFTQALKAINARIKERFQQRRRGGSKPRLADRSSIRSRYMSLCLKVKGIKKYHDSERALFESNNKRRAINDIQWRDHWRTYAQDRFSDEDPEFLDTFAQPDEYESSVSGIAYKQLARETGYSVEYVKKLVTSSNEKRPSPERTVKPND